MAFVAVAIAGGALLGGVVSAVGANAAAGTQASAAENAAQLQAQTANNSLLYQGALSNTETANQQPWYQSGEGALSQLDSLMGVTPGPAAQGVNVPSLGIGASSGTPSGTPGGTQPIIATNGAQVIPDPNACARVFNGTIPSTAPAPATTQPTVPGAPATGSTFQPSAPGAIATDANGNPTGGALTNAPLLEGWNQTFQAPTGVTEQNDPGYQFRLKQGELALDQSAAASGNLLTGGTANAEQNYGQGEASQEYNNVYNRALQGYDTNFNTFQTNQTNQYNRLAAMAGTGQTTAGQINGNLANTGANVATTMGNAATQIGQQQNNAAAATASGYAAGANAIGSGISGLGSTYGQYAMLQGLMAQNGGAGAGSGWVGAGIGG